MPCAAGTYQNVSGSVECVECPSSYVCEGEGTVEPEACPAGAWCPAGSTLPYERLCPNGTYSNALHLAAESECTPCPAGFWCGEAGLTAPSGECAEGYTCGVGSSTATPDSMELLGAYTGETCVDRGDADVNDVCPPGHWCGEGSGAPVACEPGTMSNAYGLTNASQCEPCAASYYCPDEATTVPTHGCWAGYVCGGGDVYPTELCPVGHYCEGNNSVPMPCAAGTYQNASGQASCHTCPPGAYCGIATTQPKLCPVGTFNLDPMAEDRDACAPCPRGYFCEHEGTVDFAGFICPPGTYCPEKTDELLLCPAGTHRNASGGSKLSQCLETPGGYYSEEGGKLPRYCADPTKRVGHFCPAGSGNMTVCPPGAYCPWAPPSAEPVTCPESYYCPQGSLAPRRCFNGTYCPEASEIYRWCPLGYHGAPDSNNTYGSIAEACEECPPGTHGTAPNRIGCDQCSPGYVCLGATSSATPLSRVADNGYKCPAGHYCPAGSTVEIECPKGHFNPDMGSSNISSCLPCEAGYYQDSTGSATCKSCSTSSTSLGSGSTECACLGLNRAFQPSDGYCTCDPGFEFYDENYNVQTGDGEVDCQPVVYERCSDSQVRDQTGECVDSGDCSQCGSNGGTYVPAVGACECNNLITLDEACDAECRDESSYLAANSDGTLSVCDATGNCTTVETSDIDGFQGSISCDSDGCQTVSMDTTSGGIAGVYGLGAAVQTETRRRRHLQTLGGGDYELAQAAWRRERRQRQQQRRRNLDTPRWVSDVAASLSYGNETTSRQTLAYDNISRRGLEETGDDGSLAAGASTITNPVVCISEGVADVIIPPLPPPPSPRALTPLHSPPFPSLAPPPR